MSKADKERQARRQRMLARERGHTSTYPIPGTSGDIGLRTPQPVRRSRGTTPPPTPEKQPDNVKSFTPLIQQRQRRHYTVLAVLILPVSMAILSVVMKHSQKYFQQQQEFLGNVNGQVEEIYGGHNIVRVFNKEETVTKTFRETNEKLYQSAWKSQFFSGMMMPVMQFVGNIGYVMVALVGGWQVIS